MHYLFLAELLLYNEGNRESFYKLCIMNYPELYSVFDIDKLLRLLSYMLTDLKPFIVSNMDKAKTQNVKEVKREDVTLENYYKYVDIRIRPFFKSKDVLELFANWLEIEDIEVYECLVEHQHNVFIEELVYYYKKGPVFFRQIIPAVYGKFAQKPDFARSIEKITLLFEAFEKLIDETMKDLKEKFGPDIDKRQLLNYGMDFGMIILHLARRDPVNALMQAKYFLGNVGELLKPKHWEKDVKIEKETKEMTDTEVKIKQEKHELHKTVKPK